MSCLADDWASSKWWADIRLEVLKVVNVRSLTLGVDGRRRIGIRLWVAGVVVAISGRDDLGPGAVELGIKGGMVRRHKRRISTWSGAKWVVSPVGGRVECVKENQGTEGGVEEGGVIASFAEVKHGAEICAAGTGVHLGGDGDDCDHILHVHQCQGTQAQGKDSSRIRVSIARLS